MSRTAAFSFLCSCLSSIASGRQPPESHDKNFGWATFIALAYEQRVSSAVASAMGGLFPHHSPPSGAISYLVGLAAHHRQRNQKVLEEAIEVAKILNRIDITPVFMKGGAHLFTGLYPDIGMRQMADLDILVPATRANDCVAALNAHGIVPTGNYIHPRSHHCRPLGRVDLPIPVELHHEVLAYPNRGFLLSEEMRSTATPLEDFGVRIAVPSVACAVIHNIAHAQLSDHDYLYGRIDLRGLLDLARLTHVHRDKIDWDEIRRRFVDGGWKNALEYHLQMARLLGAKIPPPERGGPVSRLLSRRGLYHARKPRMLSLSVRLLRPLVLLSRELSDSALRRRLAGNVLKLGWWRRHLRMLTDA